jgi:DNA-binding transcriptional ArsR family regulator
MSQPTDDLGPDYPAVPDHGSQLGSPLPQDFAEAAKTFTMLATPTRVRLLWLLAQSESDVTTLAEAVGASVPTASQHLAKLRLAGLVTARADGRRQIYRVEDPHINTLVSQAVEHHQDLRERGVSR